jgi:hypothetical protein
MTLIKGTGVMKTSEEIKKITEPKTGSGSQVQSQRVDLALLGR